MRKNQTAVGQRLFSSALGSSTQNNEDPFTFLTAVVLNGSRQIVTTHTFDVGETHESIVDCMVKYIGYEFMPMPERYNSKYFEVFLVSGASPEDAIQTRGQGVQIGFIEYDTLTRIATSNVGVICGGEFDYPLREDVFLGENFDTANVTEWSTRKITRTLDRLMQEHAFVDQQGLMAPFDDFGFNFASSDDALVRDQLQRRARVSDRIWTRILALCSALMLRGELGLTNEYELDFATNCTDVYPAVHVGLPDWLSARWDETLDELRVYAFRRFSKM